MEMDNTIFINYHTRRIKESKEFIKKLEEQIKFHEKRLAEMKEETKNGV